MTLNTVLIAVCIGVFVIVLLLSFISKASNVEKIYAEDFDTFEKILEGVKVEMVDILREDYTVGNTEEEYLALSAKQQQISLALKRCVYGIDADKATVMSLIRGFIDEKVSDEIVERILGVDDDGDIAVNVMYEIIMYKYKKVYGKKAMAEWLIKNDYLRERLSPEATRLQDVTYYITVEDLQQSYLDEQFVLDMDEKRDILTILIYQKYKGFGLIDTMREMDIDGFNMGTSGSILAATNGNADAKYTADNAVWLFFAGKFIHLEFMNYGQEAELKRIIQMMIRWNSPGALTAKRGYLVNTMYDQSRILAVRPPASEYWAIFVRKFTLSNHSVEGWVIKPKVIGGMIAVKLLEYLIRGETTCAVTGRQGSGKTTLMKAIIGYVSPRYNIRVLEMAPELYLREIYPSRNILSLQETQHNTAAELQDALKKSDAAVSIVGEVATDSVASRMIQMGMTASVFTIFSHHANTPKDLVYTLRNSLAADGGFDQMEIAEKQVIDVVRVDVHVDYTQDGFRYIDRICEIVPLEQGIAYPEYDPNNAENSSNVIAREFYQRTTDRQMFEVRKIMHFDLESMSYVPDNRFSGATEKRIREVLKDMRPEFDAFMAQCWDSKEGLQEFYENPVIKCDSSATMVQDTTELYRQIDEKVNREISQQNSLGILHGGVNAGSISIQGSSSSEPVATTHDPVHQSIEEDRRNAQELEDEFFSAGVMQLESQNVGMDGVEFASLDPFSSSSSQPVAPSASSPVSKPVLHRPVSRPSVSSRPSTPPSKPLGLHSASPSAPASKPNATRQSKPRVSRPTARR